MLTTLIRSGSIAAALFGAAVATAQVPARPAAPQPGQAQPGQAQATGNHYRAKQVLGAQIMIQNNTAVGTVDDIVFDEAGNLEYLIVNNDGKLSTVPFEAAQFNVEKKTAVINVTQEQFKAIPTYTATTYPNYYTPEYRTEIYKQYGLTPRQLRVIERRR